MLICMRFLLLYAVWFTVGMQTSYAEVAVATDDAQELVIANKILNPSSANQTTTTQQAEAVAPAPNIANDLEAGQQRQLPSLTAPLTDQAQLLSPAEYQQINQRLLALDAKGLLQLGVLVVPTTGDEDIFSYSLRTAEAWQLGTAKRDNGLLMTVAVNDRRIQILTGYGLEGVLPDILVNRIIQDQITPYFKQNQYAAGILAGITEIERIVSLDPEQAAQYAEQQRQLQEQAYTEQKAKSEALFYAMVILVIGVVASLFLGKKISASMAATAGIIAGLVSGIGLVGSLLMGLVLFFLLITSIAQLLLQLVGSGFGRGGGGFGGGGGFSGGGGGFGGGGASGSW